MEFPAGPYRPPFDIRSRFMSEEPKPQHSYIGLIAMAILSSPDKKLVLSDIYQWILDNYSYFRARGPGWRNSIRHNLSLNDCFIKAGRSANGKGHYWAIHPANVEDFKKGDFRRRRAQRKVRKAMGLTVPEEEDDDDDDHPFGYPPAFGFFPGRLPFPFAGPPPSFLQAQFAAAAAMAAAANANEMEKFPADKPSPSGSDSSSTLGCNESPSKKRNFSVESLLAPAAVKVAPDSGASHAIPSMRSPIIPPQPYGIHPAAFQMNPFWGQFAAAASGFPGFNPFQNAAAAWQAAVAMKQPQTPIPVADPAHDDRNPLSTSPLNSAQKWQETFAKIMARSYQGRQMSAASATSTSDTMKSDSQESESQASPASG